MWFSEPLLSCNIPYYSGKLLRDKTSRIGNDQDLVEKTFVEQYAWMWDVAIETTHANTSQYYKI